MSFPAERRAELAAAHSAIYQFYVGKERTSDEAMEERTLFYLQMLHEAGVLEPGRKLVDLGAGFSWFAPLARAFKLEVAVVDDFLGGGSVDPETLAKSRQLLTRFRDELGMEVVEQELLENPLPFADASVDAITCFHCLEHWHHSPKPLFHEIRRVLRPGGVVVFATPNAVNIRKRVSVLFGRTNHPLLEEWYEELPRFRGHVREPVVADLQRLLQWNGFRVIATHGRNFIGRDSQVLGFLPRGIRHALGKSTQAVLRYFPTLCSDIHVVGRKE